MRSPALHSVRIPIACAAIGAVALASLAFRANTAVVGHPLSEDGYYSLTIARNLAQGHGPSADGVTLTNGFQPLFTLLSALAFLPFHGDLVTPLRLVLLVHLVIVGVSASLAGAIAHGAFAELDANARANARWTTIALYVCASFGIGEWFNGLETGAAVCGYLAVWRWWQTRGFDRASRLVWLGVLLGALVLVRIDAVFFVTLVALREAWASESWSRRATRALAVVGPALVVSGPWFVYCVACFGSPMPSSGAATEAWALDPSRVTLGVEAILATAVPWFHTGLHLAVVATLARAVVVALVVRDLRTRSSSRSWAFASTVVAAVGALFVWYVASSGATAFYPRYFAPLFSVAVLAACWSLMHQPTWVRTLAMMASTAITVGSIALIHAGVGFKGNTLLAEQVPLVLERVPPDEVVGAAQSGTLGYFRPHVVNLDGKVNAQALHHRDDMPAYLESLGIRWFCDWEDVVERLLGPHPEERGWTRVGTRGRAVLYHRQ